ncbi:MAG: aminomethyl-transferring glycine dehydrogenase subunit GcvPA [Spirochaetales bacterium]|nr:MAG: aminomethyl-transferring glycine dehydrogenase subunit GcvPA [Spirochaetales bacterium]
MSFISHTPEERASMLAKIGIASGSMEELFRSIPPELRAKSFNLPDGRSELEVENYLLSLARRNTANLVYFLGGGFYDHFIPAAVDALASRSEFYTSYTPYQPEASQGTLQALYEFQSCICRLLSLEAANASLYDGGTALYEAAMMAIRITDRNKIVMDGGVNPIYRKMLYSYTSNLSVEFVEIPVTHGNSSRDDIENVLDDRTAAVITQNPNFFGTLDNHADIAEHCHEHGALLIQSVYPMALGLTAAPGEIGADIAVGEGQSLGLPLSFGGPFLGFMAARKQYVRKMPGRIAGATTDAKGRKGYVLTLQAREQHIRREKAMSNICTNQSLCALRALIFMSLYGKQGLTEAAGLCRDKAEYAKSRLRAVPGVEVYDETPTFNEFMVRLPKDPAGIIGKLIDKGIAGGFPLGRYYPEYRDWMLVAVTEKRTKQEIGLFAERLEEVLAG